MVGVEAPVAPPDAVPRFVVVGGLVDLERDEVAVQSYGIEFALDELAGDAVEERVEGREAVEEREDAALGEDARQRAEELPHVLVALGVRVEEDLRGECRVDGVRTLSPPRRRSDGEVTGRWALTASKGPNVSSLNDSCHVSRLKVTPAHFSGNASTRFSTSGCGSMTQCSEILAE